MITNLRKFICYFWKYDEEILNISYYFLYISQDILLISQNIPGRHKVPLARTCHIAFGKKNMYKTTHIEINTEIRRQGMNRHAHFVKPVLNYIIMTIERTVAWNSVFERSAICVESLACKKEPPRTEAKYVTVLHKMHSKFVQQILKRKDRTIR